MDSYLSGRENFSGAPKPSKAEKALASQQALQKLPAPDADAPVESQESCGEAGSKVEYLSQNGRVTRIVVTCACGQVTEIDCEYEEE